MGVRRPSESVWQSTVAIFSRLFFPMILYPVTLSDSEIHDQSINQSIDKSILGGPTQCIPLDFSHRLSQEGLSSGTTGFKRLPFLKLDHVRVRILIYMHEGARM